MSNKIIIFMSGVAFLDNVKFQNLVSEHMASLTQKITIIKGDLSRLVQETAKINIK